MRAMIIPAVMVAGIAGASTLAHGDTVTIPGTGPVADYFDAGEYRECANEDGNPDGQPCMWTDPDTGTRYYVNSENYR